MAATAGLGDGVRDRGRRLRIFTGEYRPSAALLAPPLARVGPRRASECATRPDHLTLRGTCRSTVGRSGAARRWRTWPRAAATHTSGRAPSQRILARPATATRRPTPPARSRCSRLPPHVPRRAQEHSQCSAVQSSRGGAGLARGMRMSRGKCRANAAPMAPLRPRVAPRHPRQCASHRRVCLEPACDAHVCER